MALSENDKQKVESELSKALNKEINKDDKIIKVLIENKDKINKQGLNVKLGIVIDPKTGERKTMGVIEILETNSEHAILDGINLDLGMTPNLDVLLGVSKDISIGNTGGKFSIGGYLDVGDAGKQIIDNIKNKTDNKVNLQFKIGVCKSF